jgi:succinyl-CoA:acetate CoA-transferase
MSAQQAARLIESGMTIGVSGFATGFPYAVLMAMCEPGGPRGLTVLGGAIGSEEPFPSMTNTGVMTRFYGWQRCRELRYKLNHGEVGFIDVHLGQFAGKIRKGDYGKLDFSVIQCMKIREDGGLVPALAAGIVNALVECSEKIIVELNTSLSAELEGIHDFGLNPEKRLVSMLDRLGDDFLPCPPEKLAAVVITDDVEERLPTRDTNEIYEGIAASVIRCLRRETESGRLPKDFTLQVGTGGVANAVLQGLREGGFKGLSMFTEILSDSALDFLDSGVFKEATTTALDLSPEALDRVTANLQTYKSKLVIRPLDVTNNAKRIDDMGLVGMNTVVEADIYGNVNSTHVTGTNMISGLGGSNDFSRSCKLSIFITPSTAKNGNISCIVPMVTHHDSTEHDTDIIATEYGFADLRGKTPKERALLIIENCAHPDYRGLLRDYFGEACKATRGAHTPHILHKAFAFQERLARLGTMKDG